MVARSAAPCCTARVAESKHCQNGKVKTVYDLTGRKVDTPTKGIYIVNGKKVFIK